NGVKCGNRDVVGRIVSEPNDRNVAGNGDGASAARGQQAERHLIVTGEDGGGFTLEQLERSGLPAGVGEVAFFDQVGSETGGGHRVDVALVAVAGGAHGQRARDV